MVLFWLLEVMTVHVHLMPSDLIHTHEGQGYQIKSSQSPVQETSVRKEILVRGKQQPDTPFVRHKEFLHKGKA